jgi:hypothetical protein
MDSDLVAYAFSDVTEWIHDHPTASRVIAALIVVLFALYVRDAWRRSA